MLILGNLRLAFLPKYINMLNYSCHIKIEILKILGLDFAGPEKNFWQWNEGLLKAADFEKHKKEKKLNSENFWNITKGTLIVKDCGITSYPCWNYGSSNLLFPLKNSCKVLDLKSLWKSMKWWELLISVLKTTSFL